MNRLSKIFTFTSLLLFFFLVIAGLIRVKTRELPVSNVESARNSISEAKKVRAHIFEPSKEYYYMAEALYDSAMSSWRSENEKFIFFRNFDRSIQFADSAENIAKLSRGNAIKGSAELKKNLIDEILILKKEAEFYEPFIRKLPLHDTLLNNQSMGRLLLTESEIAYASGNYVGCSDLLINTRQLLVPAHLYIEELLGEYFLQFPHWRVLAKKTVDESKKKRSYAILVDKFARECILYYGGKPKYSFQVELGKNWIGDKRHRGDKATPEGQYKIVDKKEGRHTNYYKALLLNYPNDEDIAQYEEEIRKGSIRRSTNIGGHIEIHGNGGKGVDWTEGCIALSDTDMDRLYKYCRSGTPVTIVGSLKPLHEILQ